jgi:hypothetical protein
MQSKTARRRDVRFLVNAAIALACVSTVAFFILVMENCVGRGELTHAQLLLLDGNVLVAHEPTNNKHN